MPIINSIEVIAKETWNSLEEEFVPVDSKSVNRYLKIVSNKDHLKKIRILIVDEEPSFVSIWEMCKAYLLFPYQQLIKDDYTHLESQILIRIGTIYSVLDKGKNQLVIDFLKNQINEFLKYFQKYQREKANGIIIKTITKKDILSRVVRTFENYDNVNDGRIGSEVEPKGYIIEFLVLEDKVSEEESVPVDVLLSEDQFELKYIKDRVLILSELGILECLEKGWKYKEESDGEILSENITAMSRLVSTLFGFPKAESVRTYLRDLKSDSKSFYTEKKKKEIQIQINSLGITPLKNSK